MRMLDVLRSAGGPLPTGVPSIASWRLHLVERQVVEVALRHGRFGGPYSPPSIKNSSEAEVFVQWSDGLCSQATLHRALLANPTDALLALRLQAYPEPFPDVVPGFAPLADIRVCVPEVRDAILREPAALVAPISRMAQELRTLETDQIRGHLTAQYARVTFATSEGADATYDSTRVAYGVDLASRAWFGHELRTLPGDADLLPRLERVRRDYDHLRHPHTGRLSSTRAVLAPGLANQFLHYYLLQNLSMLSILNGASAFTVGDLEENRRLFHPDLVISDAPVRNDHPTAFRLDDRGQAPVARDLIHEGRLVGADVSLRAARQGGLDPSPTSLTGNWLLPTQPGTVTPAGGSDLADCLEPMEDGVFIYSVLGLHTQDASRGAYSLGVPRALVVRNGKIRGFVRGTLVGNFFDDLNAPLQVLSDPLADKPILPILASFTPSD